MIYSTLFTLRDLLYAIGNMHPTTPQIALEELEHKLSEFFSGVDSVTVAYPEFRFGSTRSVSLALLAQAD